MCGICGILDVRPERSEGNIKEETIRSMCSVLKHRGPDDEGIYLGWRKDGRKNVGLAGRKRVERYFNIKLKVEKVEEIYDELIREKMFVFNLL